MRRKNPAGDQPPGTVVAKPAKVPLYYRLEQELKDRVLLGIYKHGQLLPSEHELGREFGVSRITVRRALDSLMAQRLVKKHQGLGTYVTSPAGEMVQSVRLIGYLDDTMAYTKGLKYKILSRRVIPASASVQTRLKLNPRDKVVQLRTLQSVDSKPFAYSNFYFPEAVGKLITRKDIRDGLPVLRIVEQKMDVRINHGEQTVKAVCVDQDTADILQLKKNTPIIKAQRTYFTDDGTPVECVTVRYHPDQYDFTVDLVTHPHIESTRPESG